MLKLLLESTHLSSGRADVQLLHLTEEMAAGRQESTVALRAEINALSAAILHASASRPSGDGVSTSSDDKG